MRVHYIVLLLATALPATANAASLATISKMTKPGSPILTRSLTADPHDIPLKRFLRTFKTVYDAEDEDENEGNNSESNDEGDEDEAEDEVEGDEDDDDDVDEERVIVGLLDDILENSKHKLPQIEAKPMGDAVKTLETAKKNPNTKSMVDTLKDQFNHWLTLDILYTPERIFTTLKLGTASDDVFDGPQLAIWLSYLKLYNKKNPKKKTTEFEIFQKVYGEEELTKMLFSTKYAESAGAAKLTENMIQGWEELTIPPANLFKQLKLDKGGNDLFSSPQLVAWVKYMKIFNEKIPRKKTTIIEEFTKSYGEVGLAKMLEAAKSVSSTKTVATNLQDAQFGVWMGRGSSPEYVLTKVLNLDTKKLKTDPNANIWRSYYRAYDKKNPEEMFSFTR